MANIGVTFDFAAESAKLRGDIDKVRKELGTLNATAKGIGDSFKAAGAMFAGAFSAGAIVSQMTQAAKAAIQFGDEMQKAAARTGIGAGQFALLADAAKMSDIDVTSLSKSMQKMQIAISEAGSGSKSQLQAFAALGIEFEQIRQIAPEDQFLKIADQISRLQNPADRVRASVELFGKAGAELLPFFEQGAAGIRAATDEITRMGGALSDQQIQKLADADTAVKRLSQSWTNFARTLTSAVAPALTAVLDHLSNADKSRADAVRASQINALLTSRGPTADLFNDTKALRAELAQIEARQAALLSQRRIAALSRGDGGDGQAVLPGLPSGYTPPDPKIPTAKTPGTPKKEPAGPSFYDAIDATSLVVSDPLTDPKYLMQQQLGAAMLELQTTQAGEQLALTDETNRSVLDSFLLNTDYMIAAEQAKNVTLGASMGELASMALQQGGVLGKFGKAYAIAQTVWSTGTAIMNAMAQVPYPANIAAAAGIAVKGAMQLAQIKKTNIGSGGGSIAGVSGGSTGSSAALRDTVPSGVTQSTESQQKSAVQIVIQGNLIESVETGRWLADVLGEAVNSRDLVFINAGSRQAAELRA